MHFGTVSSWARGALGPDALDRLHWHLARGMRLSILSSDNSPYRFTVVLYRDAYRLERRNVIRGSLFETVCAMLQEAGEPLPTVVEFERMKLA